MSDWDVTIARSRVKLAFREAQSGSGVRARYQISIVCIPSWDLAVLLALSVTEIQGCCRRCNTPTCSASISVMDVSAPVRVRCTGSALRARSGTQN